MNDLANQLIADNQRTNAHFLDLGHQGLTTLPDELFTLDWLEGLNLGREYLDVTGKQRHFARVGSANQVKPTDLQLLSKLSNLKYLYLSDTGIQHIEFLSRLTQLQHVDLSYNKIQDYTMLKSLMQLQYLGLRFNQIRDISFLEGLTQLQRLDLRNNQIQHTDFLKYLVKLEILEISDNRIQQLNFLENITQLQRLDISCNQIQDYSFLSSLTQLKGLLLNNNHIQDISFLKELILLRNVDLSNNPIVDYGFLGKLENLRYLNLSLDPSHLVNKNIPFQEIKPNENVNMDYGFLRNLTNLESLNLNYHKIQNTDFLKNLTQLKKIEICNSQIQDVSFLNKLTQLQSMDLSGNNIENIDFLEEMTQLQQLDLRYNNIQMFSGELLKRCPNLKILYLANNPITNIPKEIFNKPYQDVLSEVKEYFHSLQKGFIVNDEVKLIIVGNTRAGKTSLVRFLREREYEKEQESTHGIGLVHWKISEADPILQTNIWDFGGQEYYHATHRLFLDDYAVYLLVWESETNQQSSEILQSTAGQKDQFLIEHFPYSYWIDIIRHFAPKSTVLIVQTKTDKKSAESVPSIYFKEPYTIFYPDYNISVQKASEAKLKPNAADWLEFQAFERRLIEVLQNDAAKYPLGVKWVEIRNEIRQLPQLWMPYNEFEAFCQRIDSTIEMTSLLHYLSGAASTVLYYRNEVHLQDKVFINPKWVTDTIYSILSYDIREKNKGEFTRQHVYDVLVAKGIGEAEEMTKTFLKLMKADSFELIFEKPNVSDTYIAPQYLPEAYSDANALQKLKPRSAISFTLYFPRFMPRSVFVRFMVRYGNLAEDVYWKYGIVLDKQDVRIVVECLPGDRKIVVTIENKPLAKQLAKELFDVFWELSEENPDIELATNGTDFVEIGQLQRYLQNSRNLEVESKQGNWLPINEFAYLFGKVLEPVTTLPATNNSPEIFFSYAWGNSDDTREKVVNDLYISLRNNNYNVVRDKVDLAYRKPISAFMERIGKGNLIVVALSDKYLKSRYCMFELYEVFRNSKLEKDTLIERIFPIRTEEIDLSPKGRSQYREHWKREKEEWDKYIRDYAEGISPSEKAEHVRIQSIVTNLGYVFEILDDINALTIELLSQNDFAEIKNAIEDRIKKLA